MRNDRVKGDPTFIGKRGKSHSERRGGREQGFTPTEQRTKEKLMRQFQALPEGYSGNSAAYVNAPCWCHCGRLKGTHEHMETT